MTSRYWPSCDHPKGTFFFFPLFFSLFCCTYNSIDLCCCKSLEISFYWFHFSGELFFLTHFFSEQAPFLKKKKKRQREKNPPCAECLRTLGGGDRSHAVTERWKWFVFHSQQSNCSGGGWTNVPLPIRFIVRPVRVRVPHLLFLSSCGHDTWSSQLLLTL